MSNVKSDEFFNDLKTIIPNLPDDAISLYLHVGQDVEIMVHGYVRKDGELQINDDKTEILKETKKYKLVLIDE